MRSSCIPLVKVGGAACLPSHLLSLRRLLRVARGLLDNEPAGAGACCLSSGRSRQLLCFGRGRGRKTERAPCVGLTKLVPAPAPGLWIGRLRSSDSATYTGGCGQDCATAAELQFRSFILNSLCSIGIGVMTHLLTVLLLCAQWSLRTILRHWFFL